MGDTASFHFQRVSLHSVRHNSREIAPSYLLPEKYRQQNEFILYHDIKKLWDQEYAKFQNKRGKRPKFENCIYDGVLNISSSNTIDDVRKYADYLENKFNLQVTSIAIHRDEGHLENVGQPNEFCKYNYHAHIMFLSLKDCKERMRCIKKYDLSDMQDQAARILVLKRTTSKRQHLNREQYIEYAEQKDAQEKKLKAKTKEAAELRDVLIKQSKERLTKAEVKKIIEEERQRMKNDASLYTAEEYRALTALKKDNRIWTRDELNAELNKLNSAHAERIKTLEQENSNLKNKNAEQANVISALNTNSKQQAETINKLNTTNEQQATALIETTKSNQKLQETNSELTKARDLALEQCKAVEKSLITLKDERDAYKQVNAEQRVALAKAKESQTAVVTSLQAEKQKLAEDLEQKSQKLSQYASAYSRLKQNATALVQAKEQLQTENQKIKNDVTNLKSQHEAVTSALLRLCRAFSHNFFLTVARKVYERAKHSLFGERRIYNCRKLESIFSSERLFKRKSARTQSINEQTASSKQYVPNLQTSNMVSNPERINVSLSDSAHVDVREHEQCRSDHPLCHTVQPVTSQVPDAEIKQDVAKAPVEAPKPKSFNLVQYLQELEELLLEHRNEPLRSRKIKKTAEQKIYENINECVDLILADNELKLAFVNSLPNYGQNLPKQELEDAIIKFLLEPVQLKVEQHEFKLTEYLIGCAEDFSNLDRYDLIATSEFENEVTDTLCQYYREVGKFVLANSELRSELLERSPCFDKLDENSQVRNLIDLVYDKFIEHQEDVTLYKPDLPTRKTTQSRGLHR